MEILPYVVAVVLLVAWAIGFVGFHVGGIIHVLLVIAIINYDRVGKKIL